MVVKIIAFLFPVPVKLVFHPAVLYAPLYLIPLLSLPGRVSRPPNRGKLYYLGIMTLATLDRVACGWTDIWTRATFGPLGSLPCLHPVPLVHACGYQHPHQEDILSRRTHLARGDPKEAEGP